MQKKFMSLLPASIALCTFVINADTPAKKAQDIRVMNAAEMMQSCKQGQAIVKEIEEKRRKVSTELDAERQRLAKAAQEFEEQKASQALTDNALRKRQRELEDEQARFKRKVDDAQVAMQDEVQALTQEMAKNVEKIVGDVARETGADIVLDELTGRVLYARKELKVTENAIRKMDSDYASRSAKSSTADAKNSKAPETKLGSNAKDAKSKAA